MGGIVYLCKYELEKINISIYLILLLLFLFIYFTLYKGTIVILVITCLLLCLALLIDKKPNKAIVFMSDISMEFYLSHMFIFRIIEKLSLNLTFGNGWKQYIVTVFLVLIGTSIFSYIFKKLLLKVEYKINEVLYK